MMMVTFFTERIVSVRNALTCDEIKICSLMTVSIPSQRAIVIVFFGFNVYFSLVFSLVALCSLCSF